MTSASFGYNQTMKWKKLWPLLLIMIFGLSLRLYRMESLTVFLADQGYMAGEILKMARGNITLIGPVSSVGGFYNGPAMYYLNLPFFVLLKGNPLAGTIFESLLSIATIPLIYLLGKRLKNETVGLVASFLFAISPLMIDYSRAIFNTHPAVFFSTLIIYLLLNFDHKKLTRSALWLGFLLGINFQFHYLLVSLLFLAYLFPLFVNDKARSIKYYFWVTSGFILAMTPWILFELRHRLFNTILILKYFFGHAPRERAVSHILEIGPSLMGKLVLGNNFYLGLVAFIFVLGTVFYIYRKQTVVGKESRLYFLLLILVFGIAALYGGALPTHYIVAIHTTLILFFALGLYWLTKGKRVLILLLCLGLLVLNYPVWYFDKSMHPLQDGLNIPDFKKVAKIIESNKNKGNYNVAMHAQGDNRAMPLRYMLLWEKESPMPYEEYVAANTLFFLMKKTEKLDNQLMWEFTSFGAKKVAKRWSINREYSLFMLVK